MRRKQTFWFSVCFLTAVGYLISVFAARYPGPLEAVYSTGLYIQLIRPYSMITGIFPFSVAELLIISAVVYGTYTAMKTAVRLKRRTGPGAIQVFRVGLQGLLALAFIVVSFQLMWGLNYNRQPFAEIAGLTVQPSGVNELAGLAQKLVDRANALRLQVNEDEQGVMKVSGGISDMFSRAQLGYDAAGEVYPELAGRYGRPKGILLSPYFSYTGITGIYFPFTGEANVNTSIPQYMLPSTTMHEMAHQRGFAREDEANYIAYLTSTLHPDTDFQYSGVMLALNYTMNQLYRYAPESWLEIREQYSDGLIRDLSAWQAYRERYRGKVWTASNNVNNSYLVLNKQTDGVHSYGRMVDLLLADYLSAQSKKN